MTRTCDKCGQRFEADKTWQRRCWTCWRDEKDRDKLDAAEQRGYARGYNTGYADANRAHKRLAARGDALAEIPADLLRDVVQLCHPDRHPSERSDLANRTTARVLALHKQNQEAA